jgi:hypothetical protein
MPTRKGTPQRRKVDRHSCDNRVVIGEKDLGIPDDIKVICNYCNCKTDIRISQDEFYCNRCQVPIIVTAEDIRTAEDLQVPQGPNTETLVSTTPSPTYQGIRKEPKLSPSFQTLRDKGLRITNYHEESPK